MINILLAIVCSSGNSLIIKFAEKRSSNKISLLMINYIVACVFGGFLVLRSFTAIEWINLGSMPGLAFINGIFYVTTFLLLQLNIKRNGATISASLSHMGIIIPVVASIFLFNEYPNLSKSMGVMVAIISLIIISIPTKKIGGNNLTKYRWLLIPMLLCSGMADTMSKIFETYSSHSLEDLFVSMTFAVALVICLIAFFVSGEKINKYDIICGILLGLSNYLSTKFLIRAIYDFPSYLVYITYGLGIIIFTNIVNMLIMHEKLSQRDYIGMMLSMCAIILLNL